MTTIFVHQPCATRLIEPTVVDAHGVTRGWCPACRQMVDLHRDLRPAGIPLVPVVETTDPDDRRV